VQIVFLHVKGIKCVFYMQIGGMYPLCLNLRHFWKKLHPSAVIDKN
jgi:hypothetical protein